MPLAEINYLAVLVAALICMIVGALWYSPLLFAKPWMAAMGKKEADSKKDNMAKMYTLAFLSALVLSYVMAHFVDYVGATTLGTGATTGFWAWLGFVVTTHGVRTLFEDQNPKLYYIHIGYHLVEFLIIGALLAIWA